MRSAPLLLLAACTAARVSTPTVVDKEAAAGPAAPAAAAPAPKMSESHATYEHDDDAAALRPARTYDLPAATSAALARERVRGQVLVAGPLFPTAAAARGLVSTIDDGLTPMAMRVVADKGKVVQVTTLAGADCVEGFGQHYELSVFVPRTSLVPRTTAEITKTFDDGTAYAIDRGAPVRVTSAGMAWFDPVLDQTAAAPPERLTYNLAKPYAATPVPAAPGERLVCDGSPMTAAQWTARKQLQQARDATRNNAAARRVAEARAANRAQASSDAVDGLVDLALNDSTPKADRTELPYCGVAANPARSKLGGTAFAWTAQRGTDHVYATDRSYLADVGATCGRVRVAIDVTSVGRVTAAAVGGVRAGKQRVWVPKPGPVFWPDGTKAGKYLGGNDRFTRVTEHDALICVDVRGVAEEVCHRRDDVVVEK